MSDTGELSHPSIYNGVMYIVNGQWTFALDVATGKQIWRTPVQYDRAVLRIANAGAVMRGTATLYNGKLFRTTLDAHVLALDMKTGKEVWKSKFAEFKEGYKGVVAPLLANGVLITGTTGGEHATRGFLVGWDPETGKELWRTYTIPAPGEPGHETWPKTAESTPDAWKVGGGSTWQNGSYDPQLDLVYWGVGNAGPYDSKYRGDGDALYTNCVLAIRPKTGQIVWHYQFTPNDVYDNDGSNENVIVDLRVNGEMRKVIMNGNKKGFQEFLDSQTKPKVRWSVIVGSSPFGPIASMQPVPTPFLLTTDAKDYAWPQSFELPGEKGKKETVKRYTKGDAASEDPTFIPVDPSTQALVCPSDVLVRLRGKLSDLEEVLRGNQTPGERINAGFPGIRAQDCVIGRNACWDDRISGVNWCFFPTSITNSSTVLSW